MGNLIHFPTTSETERVAVDALDGILNHARLPKAFRTEVAQLPNEKDAHHRWLCHPGRPCGDTCTAKAVPSRLAAYIAHNVERGTDS